MVPEVIGHRFAKRVLTLSYEPGDHVRDLKRYTREERDRCGRNLWSAMESQIFDHACIHADPNPANFAFRRDGTVVMYDFGCVKELASHVIDGYRRVIVDGLGEDYARIEEALSSSAAPCSSSSRAGHYATLRKMGAQVPVGSALSVRFPEVAPYFAA